MLKITLLFTLIIFHKYSLAAQENYFLSKKEVIASKYEQNFLEWPKKSLVNRRRQGRPTPVYDCMKCEQGDTSFCRTCPGHPDFGKSDTPTTTTTTTTTATTQRPRTATETFFDQIFEAIDTLGTGPLQELIKTQVGLFQWIVVNVFGG